MKGLVLRNLIITFLLTISSLVLGGCGRSRLEEVQINNVVRVFWHESTRYSVQVREPNSVEIKTIILRSEICNNQQARILADVPLGNPMWVRFVMDYNWNMDCLRVLEIHIHSEKDIEGGGWDHGKFERGQTSVVI